MKYTYLQQKAWSGKQLREEAKRRRLWSKVAKIFYYTSLVILGCAIATTLV